MARPNIEQFRALADFGPQYRWDTSITLPAAVQSAITTEELNLRTTSVSVPKRTVNSIEVSNRGHKIFREGITDFSQQITLECISTVDAKMQAAVRNWGQLQWADQTGVMSSNNPADRQGVCLLSLLNNTDTVYWVYTLIGCWLQDTDMGTMTSDASDIIRPSLTFQYDYFTDGPA